MKLRWMLSQRNNTFTTKHSHLRSGPNTVIATTTSSSFLLKIFVLAYSTSGTNRISYAMMMTTSSRASSSSSSSSTTSSMRVIDSHLHVWGTSTDVHGYPFVQQPPDSLKDISSYNILLKQYMETNGIDGALIIQPINYKYDHSYVINAIRTHPTKFKGMLLFDPYLSETDAISRLEELVLQGFVGVRFNPYLWPKNNNNNSFEPMCAGSGLKVYKRCGELHIPVGIMCFQGLSLHYDDLCNLLQSSPETIMVLDHFGFTSLTEEGNASFQQLLSLASYPNVIVKISALFRLNDPSDQYENVYKERFVPLLQAFGSERLLYGSDFPFVLEQPCQYSVHKIVSSWITNEVDRTMIMSGTAERIFGPWGVSV